MDATEGAIRSAEEGTVPEARDVKAPQMEAVAPSSIVEVTSDIGEAVPLLELLKTFLSVQSAPVREVHFPAQLGETYVTASSKAIIPPFDSWFISTAVAVPCTVRLWTYDAAARFSRPWWAVSTIWA